ncbi:MAG: GNAT family N-acetyltransferase [Christensenellaceae bacterium]|jgi:ribosomal protein S18 acetylase RimI-like enzyme|nr:GNAT family N-acetyltransferase [Christensenellaceae bacterium]
MLRIEDAAPYRGRIDERIAQSWGEKIATRGVLYDVRDYPCLAVLDGEEFLGYLLYRIENGECEILALESFKQGRGVGSALIEEMLKRATERGCGRVWLVTTNDNLHAIRFYQRFGFDLRAVHIRALALSRTLKPQIPLWGEEGLPIAHEFEFEIALPERARLVSLPIGPNAELAAGIVRRAFQTVADAFQLTPQNCPSHPAFITAERLEKQLSAPNCQSLALVFRGAAVGFAALLPVKEEGAFELTRLAVLPEKRHKGYGKMLLDACAQRARSLGAAKLCIGIIDESEGLKNWYAAFGFVETAKKRYDALPFTVCEMELDLLAKGEEKE